MKFSFKNNFSIVMFSVFSIVLSVQTDLNAQQLSNAQQREAELFQQFRVIQQDEVDLFKQFNGRYDFTAIGNTLNTGPNSCNVITESSADLNLNPTQTILSAYLYWSGSGGLPSDPQFPGDYQVTLNGVTIDSQRDFILLDSSYGLSFFSCYADVTDIVIDNGSGSYTLSDLDLTGNIYPGSPYCTPTLDYGGWSIVIIYEDPSLSFLNQINLYDGLQVVDGSSSTLEITLTDLDVGTDEFSKIGFLAWEGEENLAVDESLTINGILIDDQGLNPVNNPFNSTNTYTGSQEFWNMDLDVYNLENIISPGDIDIDVVLTSGQDLILVNNLITFVIPANATPPIPGIPSPLVMCDQVPNDGLAAFTLTDADIEIINGQTGVVVTYHLTIGEAQFDINPLLSPYINTTPGTQTIFARLENTANGLSDVVALDLIVNAAPPITNPISDYFLCDNDQDGTEIFDLTSKYDEIVNTLSDITLTYYTTELDAQDGTNPIVNPEAFTNITNPQTIWVRADNNLEGCTTVGSFNLFMDAVTNYTEISVYEQYDDLVLDGITAFYLESQSSIITGGNPALTVTYYETQADAETDTNALASAYTNLSNPQTIYVRVEDNTTGCYVTFEMDLVVITPLPSIDYTFCSEDTPLEFNPPLYASASILVSDTSADYPSDTGIIGTGLGEYRLESVVLNVEGEMAQDLAFYLQPAGTTTLWELGAFAGGTDGMDTAVDLVFTDTSVNNYALWTGGPPEVDYYPQDGAFNTALAGFDINGAWYLIVQGTGIDTALVNSFCINWAMSSGDAPEIFCPADFAADNDEGVCGAVVNFAPPIALDTEDGPLDPANIVQTGGLPTGSEFPVGDNDVTFTATDSHGNETSCTFVITVNDAEPAMAVCQAVTVTLDAMGMGSIAAADLDGGSTDNCGVDSFAASQTTFSCADVGDVTVTLSVFDAAGNVATCEATVTVIDDTAPVIACIGSPGATEYMEEFDGAPADWSTTINAGSYDWTYGSPNMPNSDPFGSNAAIFDDDAAGLGEVNNASLNSPVWNTTGAEGITMSYDYSLDVLGAGETLAVDVYDGTDWVNVVTYDADVIPPTNSGDIDGTALSNGDFQVRFTYDDAGSWGWGAGVDNFMITVNTPPQPPLELELNADGTLSIPAGDLIMDVDEACGYSITSGGSSACDITTESNGLENGLFNNGAPFWVAQQVVFETSMDVTGFELNLFHDPGATIDNVLFVFYEDAGGVPGAVIGGEDLTPVAQTVIGNNFGFDVSTVSLVPTASTVEAGTYWIGTLATSSSAGITAWEVSTASDALNAHNTQDGITWSDVGAGAAVYSLTGQCGSDDPNNFNFDCSNLGENVVEVFVTDDSGNVSSCSATVIITDVTAPVLVCGPGDGATTVTVDFDGSSAPAGWSVSNAFGDWDWTFGAPGAGAAGGTEPFATNAAIFDDDAAGNGNVNNASLFTPVWDMSEATTVTMSYDYSFNELGAGETFAVDVYDGAAWQNVVTYDTDVLTPENSGVIDGSALANAEFQVRFTYDDAGSWGWNAGVDNFQIDFAVPPANPDVVTIQLGEDGTAELEAMDFLSEATDACGIDVLIADLEMVTCDDIGAPIEVTIFASDASGNISSCTIDVEVVDTMAPVLTCPEDVSVMVDPDGTHTVADYIGSGEATATDNCTDPVTDFTQDPAAGTVLGVGEWVVTFTATDEYGNVSTCEMNLDLTLLGNQDNELSNAIALYPNPAGEQVTISNSSNIALETAMIYDLNGKLVSQINLQDMQSERVIDVSSYATGVYMVQITGEQSSVVKRMIKE